MNEPFLNESVPSNSTAAKIDAESTTSNSFGNSTNTTWERATLEKLAYASLNEQKTARYWRTFVRLAWLTFFAILAWMLFSENTPTKVSHSEHTAVLEIKGEISAGSEGSSEQILSAMRNAFEDKGSKAVVMLINSPGGSPVQAGIINDEIYRLKALHKKPIYAVVEDTVHSLKDTSLSSTSEQQT